MCEREAPSMAPSCPVVTTFSGENIRGDTKQQKQNTLLFIADTTRGRKNKILYDLK